MWIAYQEDDQPWERPTTRIAYNKDDNHGMWWANDLDGSPTRRRAEDQGNHVLLYVSVVVLAIYLFLLSLQCPIGLVKSSHSQP